jgi:hypothetical protein
MMGEKRKLNLSISLSFSTCFLLMTLTLTFLSLSRSLILLMFSHDYGKWAGCFIFETVNDEKKKKEIKKNQLACGRHQQHR